MFQPVSSKEIYFYTFGVRIITNEPIEKNMQNFVLSKSVLVE
jgi:hypothetical protein